MHYEPQFRIALGAILLAAFAVRLYGHSQTLRAGKIRWIEGKLNITLRIVAGLVPQQVTRLRRATTLSRQQR